MKSITEIHHSTTRRPERILQFGEGNFLRGFVDWMIEILNEKNLFDGAVVGVQPIPQGMAKQLNSQDCLYTTVLRGLNKGNPHQESQLVTSLSRVVNPYEDFDSYQNLVVQKEIRFVVSNTTEAGISYIPEPFTPTQPQNSFPAKITALLFKRFEYFKGNIDRGLVFIPCELIDKNGDKLREYVLQYAKDWNLGEDFLKWIEHANGFTNSLVDRIVTGYPGEEAHQLWESLGYRDDMLVTGELFHLWVIEGKRDYEDELPLKKAGLNVIWTRDMAPYRTRKVRVLNGAHTITSLTAFLYGIDTVGACLENPKVKSFLKHAVFNEIVPVSPGDRADLKNYAADVLERFENPFIVHNLINISLNSVSKFTARVLPTFLDFYGQKGTLPEVMTFALAGLLAFYHPKSKKDGKYFGERKTIPYPIQDDESVLETFYLLYQKWDGSSEATKSLVKNVLQQDQWWHRDLTGISGLTERVNQHLHSMLTEGMTKTFDDFVSALTAPRVKQVHGNDNVAVAIDPIDRGTTIKIQNKEITLVDDIPGGHKVALESIPAGTPIIKYGYPMGSATSIIQPGNHVHTHNVSTNLKGTLDYQYNPALETLPPLPGKTFKGYRRPSGKVGIRNEVWIIPTVGCVNQPAQLMVQRANEAFKDIMRNRIDGIHIFTHPYGCSQLGNDHTMTQQILANLVNHPNAAGVLVLGLGCENNHIAEFKKVLGDYDPTRVRFLAAQDTSDEISDGVALLGELIEYAGTFQRVDIPADQLIVGLKCGGSDGLSGLTANPLLGQFSDQITSMGGTSILTEVPEMFGAETILMNRAQNEEVFFKIVGLINDFKEYYMRYNQVVYENPSPGNKDGGITTLEEKSLGCVQKGGRSAVVDVVPYGGTVSTPGLNLLNGPGNDIVSVTAMAASGAHMVLFTTGRGTPLGGPVPTVKVSSNNELAVRKSGWIDFDASGYLDGNTDPEEFVDFVLDIASGSLTKNEINGYREIAIFKDGVTL